MSLRDGFYPDNGPRRPNVPRPSKEGVHLYCKAFDIPPFTPRVEVAAYPVTKSEGDAIEEVLKVFAEHKTKVKVLEDAAKAAREQHSKEVRDLLLRIRELETALRTVQRLHPHDCELKQTIRNAGVAA